MCEVIRRILLFYLLLCILHCGNTLGAHLVIFVLSMSLLYILEILINFIAPNHLEIIKYDFKVRNYNVCFYVASDSSALCND